MKNVCHNPTWIATTEHPFEAHFRTFLSIALVVGIVFYVYLVGASVVNLMARKEAFASAVSTNAKVSDLEQQYLTFSHGLTPEQGTALGLHAVNPSAYIRTHGATAFAQFPTSF